MTTTASSSPSAAVWDAWEADGRSYYVTTDTELMHFTRHFPVRSGGIAVDVGCGNGAFSRQLHRFGYDVTGLDFTSTVLHAARRTPLPGVRYVHHDLNQGDPPGLPQHGIDLVVCRLVLPFLHDPAAWVRRVRDLWLRPGGRMYAVIPVVDEHSDQPGGMTEQQISDIAHGWADAVRYDLRGPCAGLALHATSTWAPLGGPVDHSPGNPSGFTSPVHTSDRGNGWEPSGRRSRVATVRPSGTQSSAKPMGNTQPIRRTCCGSQCDGKPNADRVGRPLAGPVRSRRQRPGVR